MNSISKYWMMSFREQQDIRNAVLLEDLEEYAQANELLIYKGKLIKPEDYPCDCELEDPAQCTKYLDEFSDKDVVSYSNTCRCPCHTYYEPF